MSGCRTVTASSTMEYIAFNQHKFASVIENINKELQVKGEGNVCYFPLFILLQYTSENALQYLWYSTGISMEFCTLLGPKLKFYLFPLTRPTLKKGPTRKILFQFSVKVSKVQRSGIDTIKYHT